MTDEGNAGLILLPVIGVDVGDELIPEPVVFQIGGIHNALGGNRHRTGDVFVIDRKGSEKHHLQTFVAPVAGRAILGAEIGTPEPGVDRRPDIILEIKGIGVTHHRITLGTGKTASAPAEIALILMLL